MIPILMNIGSKSINTVMAISLMGIVCWCFVLWYEAKKDGFNSNRFFDLIFLSILSSSLIYYLSSELLEWLRIYRPSNLILSVDSDILIGLLILTASLLPIYFFSKKFKWSIYRILDIYSVAFCLLLMFFSIANFLVYKSREYVILFLLLLILYLFVMRFRGYKFISGVIFSIFLFFLSLVIGVLFRKSGYLLFGPTLVIISMLNLYSRSKKNMSKILLPKQFMSNLKDKLMSKEKKLNEEQKALIRDDPYLQQGRSTDNAETMDDVLEDTGKIVTDARMGIVRNMKTQVRKALAAIKLGRYGKCELCGRSIDIARLRAYPEATTCIDCATDQSQRDDIRQDRILEENA